MEPRRDEPHRDEPKDPRPRPEEKRLRFRIVKLEERIAPKHSRDCSAHNCNGADCTGTLSIE
jgi:hypothetical protein